MTLSPQDRSIGTIFLTDMDRVDVALFDRERGIVGESWHADLKLTGTLDTNGFVYDFSPLKAKVKQLLRETADHALIVPTACPGVVVRNGQDATTATLTDAYGFTWRYETRVESYFFVDAETVTPENVAAHVVNRLRKEFPQMIHQIGLTLRPEVLHETEAYFHYTHGITGHTGLCQRLFHGHRSKVVVLVDGERRADLEHKTVRDILGRSVHISCPKQIPGVGGLRHLDIGVRGKDSRAIEIDYIGTQGQFRGHVPADRLIVIENETSIENFAHHLAKVVASRFRLEGRVTLQVYEGIGKGAEARA